MKVTMIGGGMIAHDQILPSLYHLQRKGVIEAIEICDRRAEALDALAQAPKLAKAFPGQGFTARAEAYAEVVGGMAPGNLVVVCVPDHLHHEAAMTALAAGQNVLCVKPLVLTAAQAGEIEHEARERSEERRVG